MYKLLSNKFTKLTWLFVHPCLKIRAVITRSWVIAFTIYRWFSGRRNRFSFARVFSTSHRISSQIFLLAARAKDPIDGESNRLFWTELGHVPVVQCDTQVRYLAYDANEWPFSVSISACGKKPEIRAGPYRVGPALTLHRQSCDWSVGEVLIRKSLKII